MHINIAASKEAIHTCAHTGPFKAAIHTYADTFKAAVHRCEDTRRHIGAFKAAVHTCADTFWCTQIRHPVVRLGVVSLFFTICWFIPLKSL